MSGALAKAVAASPPPADSGMRTGVVASINSAGTGVTVTMNGATVPSTSGQYLPCLSSYLPRVGDVVALFRQDSSWIVLGATSRTTQISRYTDIGRSLTGAAWNVIPMSTLASGPGVVNNGAGTFTLGIRGVWTVTFAIHCTPGSSAGIFAGLCSDTSRTLFYADGWSTANTNLEAVTVSADIESDGTVQVVPQVFASTAAATVAAGNGLPRLTFRLNP